jgi:hypothetical protein
MKIIIRGICLTLFDITPVAMADALQEKVDAIRSMVVSENTKSVYFACLIRYLTHLLAECDSGTAEEPSILTAQFIEKFGSLTGKPLRAALLQYLQSNNREISCMPLKFELLTAENFFKWSISNVKRDGEYLKATSYASHKSALHHLFRMCRQTLSTEFDDEWAELIKGLKRDIAKQTQDGHGKMTSGKDPLDFALYQYLSKYLLGKGSNEAIFAHCFLTMTWNLICRAGSTVSICLNHLKWKNDSMLVYFSHMKNDQLGDKPRDPRHIYANPILPDICPVLSLGIYLLCFPSSLSKTKLFDGKDQYDRFRKIMGRTFENKECIAELSRRGIYSEDIGTHSIRKGAATFCASGSTACPSPIALHLRAGWALGGVQDTYMRYQAAGDQHVGRTVSGLPTSSVNFAALPPHFEEATDKVKLLIDRVVKICFPNARSEFMHVARYCLASVTYHSAYLRTVLPRTHPLFNTPIFLNGTYLKKLVKIVTINESDSYTATGLPPHISLLSEMKRIRGDIYNVLPKLESVSVDVVEGVVRELEDRAIGAGTVTRDGLRDLLKTTLQESGLMSVLDMIQNPAMHVNNEDAVDHIKVCLNSLPDNFEIPSGTPHAMYTAWHFGNSELKWPPLKGLKAFNMSSRVAKQKLSDLGVFVKLIESCLAENDRLIEKPTLDEVTEMGAFACDKLFEEIGTTAKERQRRSGQLAWTTTLKELRVLRKAINSRETQSTRSAKRRKE